MCCVRVMSSIVVDGFGIQQHCIHLLYIKIIYTHTNTAQIKNVAWWKLSFELCLSVSSRIVITNVIYILCVSLLLCWAVCQHSCWMQSTLPIHLMICQIINIAVGFAHSFLLLFRIHLMIKRKWCEWSSNTVCLEHVAWFCRNIQWNLCLVTNDIENVSDNDADI